MLYTNINSLNSNSRPLTCSSLLRIGKFSNDVSPTFTSDSFTKLLNLSVRPVMTLARTLSRFNSVTYRTVYIYQPLWLFCSDSYLRRAPVPYFILYLPLHNVPPKTNVNATWLLMFNISTRALQSNPLSLVNTISRLLISLLIFNALHLLYYKLH